MSTLRVTEMGATGVQRVTGAQIGKLKGCTQNPVTFTGTAGISAAFQSTTKLIRVRADVNCAIKIGGSTVTAATTDTYLKADEVEYFDVDGGDYISAVAT